MSRAQHGGGFPLHNGAGVYHHLVNWPAAVIMFALMLTAFPQVDACGLEPTLRGGFTVSYPGSLDVAVAVANARREGLLPPAETEAIANDVRLRQMLVDLRRLQARLNGSGVLAKDGGTAPFSLVLVGPGLWSHYFLTPGGVLARYHIDGPLGESVVLTHHAVLRALLNGDLGTVKATELGLIAYTGSEVKSVRTVLESGFQANS
jgi:hypothetical protein